MTYTREQYRREIAAALREFAWWERPLVRLALRWIERDDRWGK